MKRIKAIIPAGDKGSPAMPGHIRLVDADTGEDLLPLRSVDLHFPFDAEVGIVSATVELFISEIETVPAAQIAETFPQWKTSRTVGFRQ